MTKSEKTTETTPRRGGALIGFVVSIAALVALYVRGDLQPGQDVDLFRSLATGLIILASLLGHVALGRWVWRAAERHAEADPEQSDKRSDWHIWLQLIVSMVWWVPPAFALIWLWGMWGESSEAWQQFVWGGFAIGDATIVPGKIGIGIGVIILLMCVMVWIKRQLEERWLAKTPLEPATRNTVATIFGYVAFILIFLFGLDMAGLELGKLALVAGALSVGIGFGLQNIVNNFVSGIILIFERPIKMGDYIDVAGHEGFVRKLRIRATEIETLDRLNVVVPNSELIGGALINWTLHDRWARIYVRVGVAYGSDTELVKKLLIEAAKGHPQVIPSGGLVPGPEVLFEEFGDSSLNFAVRFYIKEITRKPAVRSDVNFAIDAAFREHNVVIPFPQRDLWLKEMPAKSQDDSAESD